MLSVWGSWQTFNDGKPVNPLFLKALRFRPSESPSKNERNIRLVLAVPDEQR